MSTWELARHIAVTEIWFLDAVISVRTCGELTHWYAGGKGSSAADGSIPKQPPAFC
jgi:hypothetical protein